MSRARVPSTNVHYVYLQSATKQGIRPDSGRRRYRASCACISRAAGLRIERRMPAAGAAVPAVVEGAGQLEDLDEPPEPRARGGGGRTGLMKPLVVLALPGMYLFYKYSQYRREQRELSRRRVTERELQHLHHKIIGNRLGDTVNL